MVIELSRQHIRILDQQEQQHYAEMVPTVIVGVVGVHVRIMVVLLDGTKWGLWVVYVKKLQSYYMLQSSLLRNT